MALSADNAQVVVDTLKTPPANPSATIDWGNDKHKVILPKTWQTKNLEERLMSARHDLIKAGYPEDARLLTISRLNGCWNTKVSSPERKALKEGRKKRDGTIKTPSVTRKRAHKDPKQARIEEAESFGSVTSSLGVKGGNRYSASSLGGQGNPFDDNIVEAMRPFSLRVDQDGNEDDPICAPEGAQLPSDFDRQILCSGMVVEGARYDVNSSDVFLLRVSAAGVDAHVGAPVRTSEKSFYVPVTRRNQRDLILLLKPDIAEGDLKQAREDTDFKLKAKFGHHVGYDVINTAYSSLVHAEDAWTVTVEVNEPFSVGDTNKFVMLRGGAQSDSVVIIPLLKERPELVQEPTVIDI